MRISVSNVAFFCIVGFLGDCLNFTAVQSEIFLSAGHFKATELQLGILGFVTSLGYAIMAFGSGVISERAGRRPMCLIGTAGLMAAYLTTPHITSLTQLYALCFVRSIFSAFLWVPIMAWMARAEDHDRLPRLLGKYNMSWGFGILSGFYVAGAIFHPDHWQWGFHVAAALAFVLLMFIFLCEPHGGHGAPAHPDEATPHDLKGHEVTHFVRQGLLMLTIGTFLCGLVVYMFPKVGGSAVHEKGQSILNVFRLAGQMVTFMLFGHMAAWHFRRWPLLLCATSMGVGVLLVAMGHHYWVYAAGFALLGAGFGIAFTMSSFYALGLSESKGKGSGIMETLVGGGSLVGPLYGGAIGMVAGSREGVLAGIIPLVVILGWAVMKPSNVRSQRAAI